jgi:hypothetical protein
MRLYDSAFMHMLDKRLFRHRWHRFCGHLWCWHVLDGARR